jgi:FKBP-type peptidyl-prolyl cis-trans isomerase
VWRAGDSNDNPTRSIEMKKTILALAAAALAAGCAQTPESKPGAAPAAAAAPAARTACASPPSELEVKDLEPGSGEAARFRTAVLVHYTGWVFDGCKADRKGEQFDSSVGRPMPFSVMVGVGRVIRGWDEGLVGMKEGGKRLLVIPAHKAYGERSPTPKIPPNSALVFEVQLVKVIAQPPA